MAEKESERMRKWRMAALTAAIAAAMLVAAAPDAALAGGEREAAANQESTAEPDEITELAVPLLAIVPPAAGLQITKCAVAAPRETDGTVPLYAQPNEDSDVLMTYYSGAPLEAIRKAGGFWQVQAGEKGASVMGYMRGEDIRVGATARREAQPCFMRLEFNREAPVYAYCDENAPMIGLCTVGNDYYAMGKNDGKWVQLYLPPQAHAWESEGRAVCGFVKLETGMARGYWQELSTWVVEPVTGEMSAEQAVELAVEMITGDGKDSYGFPEVFTIRESVEKMAYRAQRLWWDGADLWENWVVFFWEEPDGDVARVYLNAIVEEGKVEGLANYISAGLQKEIAFDLWL